MRGPCLGNYYGRADISSVFVKSASLRLFETGAYLRVGMELGIVRDSWVLCATVLIYMFVLP